MDFSHFKRHYDCNTECPFILIASKDFGHMLKGDVVTDFKSYVSDSRLFIMDIEGELDVSTLLTAKSMLDNDYLDAIRQIRAPKCVMITVDNPTSVMVPKGLAASFVIERRNAARVVREMHLDMVPVLAKPGEDIVEELCPHSAHLIHMAMGMHGELKEIWEAIEKEDKENLAEELGDFEFYFSGMNYALLFNINDLTTTRLNSQSISVVILELLKQTGELTDLTKKVCMYNKDVESIKFYETLTQIRYHLNTIYRLYGISYTQVLLKNYTKLYSGPKARYSAGFYSNQQAQARADKQEA
jgi:hypothetical protein